jgi:hypothetical protein
MTIEGLQNAGWEMVQRFYSYAKNKDISVAQFLSQNHIAAQIHLHMSVQAIVFKAMCGALPLPAF